MRDFYQVRVAEVVRETDDACSLVLDVPPDLEATFGYRPGQFVTVRVPSEQTDLDEGYILACQARPLTPEVSITY